MAKSINWREKLSYQAIATTPWKQKWQQFLVCQSCIDIVDWEGSEICWLSVAFMAWGTWWTCHQVHRWILDLSSPKNDFIDFLFSWSLWTTGFRIQQYQSCGVKIISAMLCVTMFLFKGILLILLVAFCYMPFPYKQASTWLWKP